MVVRIEMFSDLACPYAYLATFRVRRLRAEFEGRVIVEPRALPIEIHDEGPVSRRILEAETDIVLLQEPEIPYRPWPAVSGDWPVTMLPAFEAVKCAAGQSPELGRELDWRIRKAFFHENRCVSLRHELLDLAREVGADATEWSAAFDQGAHRAEVMSDARRGWTELNLRVSPTFVLPSGKRYENPAGPKIKLDEKQNHKVVGIEDAPAHGEDALDIYREMFHDALATVGESVPR